MNAWRTIVAKEAKSKTMVIAPPVPWSTSMTIPKHVAETTMSTNWKLLVYFLNSKVPPP